MKSRRPDRDRLSFALVPRGCAWAGVALGYALLVLLLVLFMAFHAQSLALFDSALAAVAIEANGDAATGLAQQAELDYRRRANALPLLMLSMLLLGLTRRPLLSLWLTSVAAGLLYAVDRLKFEHLHAHLVPADLLLLPQVIDSPGVYLHYLQAGGTGPGPPLLVLALTVLLCLEPAQVWLRTHMRIGLVLAAGVLVLATAQGDTVRGHWYERERLGFAPWTPSESVGTSGLIASLVKLAGEAPWRLPDADPMFVEHVIALHAEPMSPAAGTGSGPPPPDIIVWQSESLFAIGRLHGMRDAEHLPHLNRLRQRSVHGDMLVPTYGGGTVRTEFEVLTGYPMRAFHGINYPYSALAQRPLLALPRHLRDHGYRTVAIHPHDGGFWARDRAFVSMGFDRFEDIDHFDRGDTHGWFVGDDALLRRVAETLASKQDHPLFLFAISMENHGPWQERPGIDHAAAAAIAVPERLDQSAAGTLRNYLYHARRADQVLHSLVQLLERRQRHTVLVFYGDHLPGLERVFAQLGFRDGQAPWQQPVPFLVFDNRGGHTGAAGGPVRSYHLASLVLDAAGVRGSPLYRVLGADRERHGATGLARAPTDPVLDYDHALAHLSWHYFRHGLLEPPPPTAAVRTGARPALLP